MNKKILISLSVIGVVAALAIGGTIAYYNDVENSSGNAFNAGTLNLKVGSDDPTTRSYSAEDIKPGYEDKDIWELRNTGSLDGYLHITFSNLINNEMGCPEPESNEGGDTTCDDPGENQGELAQNLDILIYLDENEDEDFDLGADTLIYQGKVKGILQGDLFNYRLNSGDKKDFIMEMKLASSVRNIVQSDKAGYDINFELTQNKQEEIVGDWHFNENAGAIAYDSSGYGNQGTINGATWANGKYNPALSFDGIDDYIQVSHSASLNVSGSEITLEAWIKANALPPSGQRWQILGKADAYALQIADGGGGKARVWLGPLTTYIQTDSPEISTDVWYHLVGVYDSSSVKIYINGALKKEVSKTGNQATSANNLIIGARLPGGYFNGIIDEARIYNRALSASEVSERYNAGN